jgi:hypothetical protein
MAFTTVWKELCILIAPAPRMCCRESEESDRIQHRWGLWLPCDNPNTLSKVLACSRKRVEVTLTHQIHFLFLNSYIILHTGAVASRQSPLVLSGPLALVSRSSVDSLRVRDRVFDWWGQYGLALLK